MFVLGIDPGWRNTGMCMIEWTQGYDTLAPLAMWVDDLLGDQTFSNKLDSAFLTGLLTKWLEQRRDVLQLADTIVIEWQKDRKLNMFYSFLSGAFPGKVVYFSKRTAHALHNLPCSNSNHKNKERVLDYMKHFLNVCPDTYFAPGVERHHAADAAFLAASFCIQKMSSPISQAGNETVITILSCMTKWLPDCF